MAIYRPQRPAWMVGLMWGVVGLLIGVLVGWGLLRPDPDPAEVLGEARSSLASAAGTLEVVEIEYAESVRDGEVVASPEFEGALDALASSRERYEEARPAVAAVDPATASTIDRAYDALGEAMEQRVESEEVATLVQELRDMLNGAFGA